MKDSLKLKLRKMKMNDKARSLHKCEQKDAMPLGWLMNVR